MRHQTAFGLLVLFGLIVVYGTSQAQSTAAALKTRLNKKTLYLRGCWGSADLSFDAKGKLVGPARTTSFTLSGFELKSLQLKNGQLTLKGKRIGIEFIKDKQRLIAVHIDDPKIEIAAPPNGDYGPALDAIFTDDLTSLASPLPVYWETWGRKNIPAAYVGLPVTTLDDSQPSEEDRPAPETTKPKYVGGSMLAPQMTQHTEAEFDEAARKVKYSGKTLIRLVVDADGRPRHVRIDKPTGLGLDEQAVDAVGQYLFKPATQNGKPVPVEIIIEVNFQIF